MFEIKSVKLTTEEGKRNVRNANAVRKQMVDKVKDVLIGAGFDATIAANGDIAIPTCRDEATDSLFYIRLTPTFTDKSLDYKLERRPKKVEDPEPTPSLFD